MKTQQKCLRALITQIVLGVLASGVWAFDDREGETGWTAQPDGTEITYSI